MGYRDVIGRMRVILNSCVTKYIAIAETNVAERQSETCLTLVTHQGGSVERVWFSPTLVVLRRPLESIHGSPE